MPEEIKLITEAELRNLTKAELIALTISLQVHNQALDLRIAALEAQLNRPKKHSGNSSSRPSNDRKGNKANSQNMRSNQKGHGKGGRRLHISPDQTIRSQLKKCPDCGESLAEEDHSLHNTYDHIELPQLRPIVTRVMQFKVYCSRCQKDHIAPAPQGYENGSPFGRTVEAMASYLRYCHAIGYERLSQLFKEIFSLEISEGGLANLFNRLKNRLDPRVEEILALIRSSRVICSDETGARVKGKNQWQWVFQNEEVCLHVIRDSRGKQVVEEILGGHRPTYWVSDLYSAQRGHADKWQICLAHQLRDCEYMIESGDKEFGERLRLIFWRATAIAKRRRQLQPSSLKKYHYDLERRLDHCLALTPTTASGRKLKRRMLRERGYLFTFLEDAEVEPTNNSSEQALRPSVIFRKVTNGFRSDWGRDFYSAIRSVIDTGKRQKMSAYQSIVKALGSDLFLSSAGPITKGEWGDFKSSNTLFS